MAAVTLIEDRPVPRFIYSNVREIVEQNRYLFETLWSMARPAAHRIAEIEQDREMEFTQLISNLSKAAKAFARPLQSAEKKVSLLFSRKGSFQKAHGGGNNNNPGRGSMFSFTIPLT